MTAFKGDAPTGFVSPLPVMDVETLEKDPRRREDRNIIPMSLSYISDDGIVHAIQFHIELARRTGFRTAPAAAVNCSAGGLCMVSTCFARPGEKVGIVARDTTNGLKLFSATYLVCGRSHFDGRGKRIWGAAGRPPEESFHHSDSAQNQGHRESGSREKPTQYRYALRQEHDHPSQVLKAFLDTLLIEFLDHHPEASLTALRSQSTGHG